MHDPLNVKHQGMWGEWKDSSTHEVWWSVSYREDHFLRGTIALKINR